MIELIKNERDNKIAELLQWLRSFNVEYPLISHHDFHYFSYEGGFKNDSPKIMIPSKYNDRFESLLKEVYEDVYNEYECLLKEK